MTGVYGKLPSYADFIRSGLPQSFVTPWDEWLQTVVAGAREALGDEFTAVWDAAPGMRFSLPSGVCGDSAVAGVLLTSQDSVGRRFPLTLAALTRADRPPPDEAWFASVEDAGRGGRDRLASCDALLSALPADPGESGATAGESPQPPSGWWTQQGRRWALEALPSVTQFRLMLQQPGEGADRRGMGRGISHPGTVRARNEDAFVVRGDIGLWAVADGAGGHDDGDVASSAAVAALAAIPASLSAAEVLAQVRLRLGDVHTELQRRAACSASGDSTATTVVVVLARGDHFACLWAGDSRAYLLRKGTLSQVTHDHSLVQELVDAGMIAPDEAEGHPQANVITRAVGAPDTLQLDKVSGRLLPGDLLLLCTDGLFKAVPESEIANLLTSGGGPEQLLDCALRAGARDNVTALVVAP